MPVPLAIPAGAALLGKVGTALKGLKALGAAKQLAIPGLKAAATGGGKLAAAKRFAGKALSDYMGPGGVTPGNLAMNFGFDAGFGVMAGLNTPGDLGDKLIAGTTSGLGGALGGVGAVSALGKHKNNLGLRMLGEFGGGYAGDMGGMYVGDALMRAKGGGTTPYERMAAEGDAERQREIEERLMQMYGLAGHRPLDPFMADNGLGG